MNAFHKFQEKVSQKHALFGQDIDSITARMKILPFDVHSMVSSSGDDIFEIAFNSGEYTFEEAAAKLKQIVKDRIMAEALNEAKIEPQQMAFAF